MKQKWRSLEYKTKVWIIAGIAVFVVISMIWG